MTFERTGQRGLEYYPCRYPNSRILFRGPKRRLQGDYIAFLGGTEIFGQFLREPVPGLVERALGKTCVNFGVRNAGLDVYLNEPTVMEAAASSAATVIQVMGAPNMSNRFYTVHPRRNDRFLKASRALQDLYHEVDFTEFNFNRHLLHSLQSLSPDRFAAITEELSAAWISRMKHMSMVLRNPTILLWFSEHAPDEDDFALLQDPLFVNRAMIEALRPYVDEVVEVVASSAALVHRTDGMVLGATDRPAAEELLGPMAHQEAANALIPVLSRVLS